MDISGSAAPRACQICLQPQASADLASGSIESEAGAARAYYHVCRGCLAQLARHFAAMAPAAPAAESSGEESAAQSPAEPKLTLKMEGGS